jgi:hypothetical protein
VIPLLLVLVATSALAGCGGEAGAPGGGGLGIATTQTVTPPAGGTAATTTSTTAGTTRPAATTGPGTTGQAVRSTGGRLTFRAMTIRLRPGWRATRDAADRVTVASGAACRRSLGGVDCPGFLLLGPSQIAIGAGEPRRRPLVDHQDAGTRQAPDPLAVAARRFQGGGV